MKPEIMFRIFAQLKRDGSDGQEFEMAKIGRPGLVLGGLELVSYELLGFFSHFCH